MSSVRRLGVKAELTASHPDPVADDARLPVALEPFAVLAGSRRIDAGAARVHVDIYCPGDSWSLELIEAEVLGEVDRILDEEGPARLFGGVLDAIGEASGDEGATAIAVAELEVELGSRLWRRFSAVSELRPPPVAAPGPPSEPGQAAQRELEQLLNYVRHCGEAADRTGRQDIRTSTLAYVGGALTTLLHLGHIDERQHSDWHARLVEALGEPPGGWNFQSW